MSNKITEHMLFCDGGVIRENPSRYGGTWAYRVIAPSSILPYEILAEYSGLLLPEQLGDGWPVTNNQTEMLAALNGLRVLPYDWAGVVCSDSNITLGRLFRGDRWTNIPAWMIEMFREQKNRLVNWGRIAWRLYCGHPNRAEIAQGYTNKPSRLPVSIHNVRCDELCGQRAREFIREHGL